LPLGSKTARSSISLCRLEGCLSEVGSEAEQPSTHIVTHRPVWLL
jgi:hypothetical protein